MASICYLRYPGDYARKTAHLSMTEHGAYTLLMDHYYSTGKPLPTDMKRLFQITKSRSKTESNSVRAVIDEFFTLTPDGYVHKRIEEELVKQRIISEKRSNAAKERWKTGDANAYANAHANGYANGDAKRMLPIPIPNIKKEKKIKQKQEKKTEVQNANALQIELPEWMPKDLWDDYKLMRQKKRAPLTQRAAKLILKSLERLKVVGNDPVQVLERSIENSWTSVYPLPDQQGQKPQANAQRKVDAGWMRSQEGIRRMGEQAGIRPRTGESWNDYAQRVAQQLSQECIENASKAH